jgi:hypothetical protein
VQWFTGERVVAWNPVIISKKVGKDSDNSEEDVKKIQTLLNLVRIGPHLKANGHCDQDTITAIGNFQRVWENSNHRIDPGDKTLQRLNDTVKPLALKKIELSNISQGGYTITYKGFVPPSGYRVMFYLQANQSFFKIPDDAIDITKEGLDNNEISIKLNFNDTLPKLLALIAREEAWGTSCPCNIYLIRKGGYIVSKSDAVNIQCPVEPYDKPIGLNMAEIDPPIKYPGKEIGRYFYPQTIAGKRYFTYRKNSMTVFETEPDKRGFDCITYVGTVLGLNPLKKEMSGNGGDIARIIHAESCQFEYEPGKKKEMENINRDMLNYFFTNNNTGSFIVWSASHVVLVVNNIVHEFNEPDGNPGYYKREVGKRPWISGNIWHIRKIPSGRI